MGLYIWAALPPFKPRGAAAVCAMLAAMLSWQYIVAVVVAVFASSLSDWYFMGVLWHDKYLAHPEVWRRPAGGKGENLAVAWAQLLSILTCGLFIHVAAASGQLAWWPAVRLACGIWLMVPVPLLITNALFIKIHPLNTLASLLGWLAKLLICAIAARLFLG